MAVGIVAGLTGSDEGLGKLLPEADVIAAALLPLLSANKVQPTFHLTLFPTEISLPSAQALEISLPSAQALVNLSQHDVAAKAVIKARGVETAGGMAVGRGGAGGGGGGGKGKNAGLMVMLLANLTQLDEGAEKLLEPSGSVPLLASLTRRFAMSADREEGQEDDGSVPLLASLTRRFATSADREEGQEDEYEHVATILVNATRLEAARKLLLDPEKKLLRQILPQTSSPNRIRSQGAMATVRNCCFDASSGALPSLLLLADLLWPSLLLPLAGTRVYSKEDRDQMPPELAVPLSMERPPVTDAKLRADAADALFLISSEEAGRKALWAVHGARILQVGYEDEEDPTVMEAMERVGSLVSGWGCDVVVWWDSGKMCSVMWMMIIHMMS
ncbi:unnamed protein product [Closterium sp. NIES-65]|nr:unnamed protein product [Closterium sp. NIES-65]